MGRLARGDSVSRWAVSPAATLSVAGPFRPLRLFQSLGHFARCYSFSRWAVSPAATLSVAGIIKSHGLRARCAIAWLMPSAVSYIAWLVARCTFNTAWSMPSATGSLRDLFDLFDLFDQFDLLVYLAYWISSIYRFAWPSRPLLIYLIFDPFDLSICMAYLPSVCPFDL